MAINLERFAIFIFIILFNPHFEYESSYIMESKESCIGPVRKEVNWCGVVRRKGAALGLPGLNNRDPDSWVS